MSNATTNSFVESKRLNFSNKKCHRIHVGKKDSDGKQCNEIFVHENKMDNSENEKYVGDIIFNDGKIEKNIAERRAKGFIIAGDIISILDEVPLGVHRVEAGLLMRNAMLLNGILTNSEVWIGLSEQHHRSLEQVDEYLLKGILKTQCNGPTESLYLETGTVPIRFIIQKRRLNYLHHLITRNSNELISKIYFAQLRKPGKNDWAGIVDKDKFEVKLDLSNIQIRGMKKEKFKKYVNDKVLDSAFNYLESLKQSHSKVENISYEKLKMAPYLKDSSVPIADKIMILKLRTSMINVKKNFSSMYNNTSCDLCDSNLQQTQRHLLSCSAITNNCSQLRNNIQVNYSDLFSSVERQQKCAQLYSKILETKERLELAQ